MYQFVFILLFMYVSLLRQSSCDFLNEQNIWHSQQRPELSTEEETPIPVLHKI